MTSVLLARLSEFFARPAAEIAVDLLDIGIVALVVYRVLVVIKGTRAMQMGIGLSLVLLAHQVARWLELVTLYTMLDALLTSIVLIIIVVFQNDIRRALSRVGSRSWLRGQATAQETHVIEEVIKAAQMLAQKRIGALIVFERDATLDEFLEQGTVLDAAVSKELLYSIFIPSFENPVHDGAVVIRDRRVWQAGAFLPLTASPKLDKTIGTRHRAAVGITEETDAVVVVVSEEKGAISLCFNGNMVRNLDAPSLREALLGLFYRKKPARRAPEAARPSLVPGASRPPTGSQRLERREVAAASGSSPGRVTTPVGAVAAGAAVAAATAAGAVGAAPAAQVPVPPALRGAEEPSDGVGDAAVADPADARGT
jgi:uncharacterized protein (TIGR00159 family)